ncbi:MAG: hypothetical protein AAF571_13105 [Verrucomicrobiota bacterium]
MIHRKIHKLPLCVCILLAVLCCGNVSAPPLQAQEKVRTLTALPAIGEHPRVFFTADELPEIRKRLESDSNFNRAFTPTIEKVTAQVIKDYTDFSQADFSDPTVDELNRYVRPSERRNIYWGMASLYSVVFDDEELKQVMIGTIVNYARLLLVSYELKTGGDVKGGTGLELNKQFNIWETNGFDVKVSWTIGAAGFALSYDVLFNDMTAEQRATVRKAIAISTKGRQGYGTGMPRGFAASNHYGYHGDLLVLLAAIEGEEGFDQETYDNISKVLQDYWEVGFTPAGACHEDGYGPSLGLRAGGRGMMTLARRGYNIFETQKFRNFVNYIALDYEPQAGGMFMGGASGGPYDSIYPTATLIARYMYPDSTASNYIYRYMTGDHFERGFKWQGWLDFMIYGDQWQGPESRQDALQQAEFPLTVYYPARGKQVFRSDWSEDALQFTLDARPDAFLIGHDRVDRGNITMSALGRMWVFAGDFRNFTTSQMHSLVHIDGKAQAYKAPSVKFLWQSDTDKGSIAVADLKYAYDWEWTPPWPKPDEPKYASWEKEKQGPVDLGWPADYQPDWLPDQLYGSETGYRQTNGLRRRPYNEVEQAIRATVAVRGENPFVIVADNIQKDRSARHYEWYLQLPIDLKIKSQSGRDLILGEVGVEQADGQPNLLVRVLRADDVSGTTPDEIDFRIEDYVAKQGSGNQSDVMGKRLIASVESEAPHFRVMLYPFRTGDQMPETTSTENGILAVWPDQESCRTCLEP